MKTVNWLVQCLVACALHIFVAHAEETVWREGYPGHGTVHEQLGQRHVPDPIYSDYVPRPRYRNISKPSFMGMTPVYGLAHGLLQVLFNPDNFHLSDYISVSNGSTLTMERRTISNDWKPMLAANKLLIVLLLFFLLLMLAIPILGILYCSLCWCRCKRGCPPCTAQREGKMCVVCSIIMIFLLIGLIIGTIIAFIANKQISRGMRYAKERLMYSGEDTCAFLKDVSDHIDHLLVTNYQELKEHVVEQATDAYKHLFLDLADTSDGNALVEMENILTNMIEARVIMKRVIWRINRLVFLNANYRDGMRYFYRETYRAFIILCNKIKCDETFMTFGFQNWATKCMHMDLLPNSTVFWSAIDQSVKNDLVNIPRQGIIRLWQIGEQMKEIMAPTIPPLITKLDRCATILWDQRHKLNTLIDEMLNDVHKKTVNSGKSLDGILTDFGNDRNAINIFVCLTLMLIIVLLIIGLVWGMCVRTNNVGSYAMLVTVMVIFCVFSLITIVGLFYLILGLLTYHGACRSDIASTNSFMDSRINETVADEEQEKDPINATISNNLFECRKDESIFDLLKENGVYDVNKLRGILEIEEEVTEFEWHKGDLSKLALISAKDMRLLYKTLEPLFPYHSSLYTDSLCMPLTRTTLKQMADKVEKTGLDIIYTYYKGSPMYSRMWMSSCTFFTAVRDTRPYLEIEEEIPKYIATITRNVKTLDRYLYTTERNFNETFQRLIDAVVRSQEFINKKGVDYINNLGKNLTESIAEQTDRYLEMVISESNNVGRCAHLSDLYTKSIGYICEHLIDPINAFWVGVLLCCLLLIPILYVAHRLICLYRVYPVYMAKIVYLERDGYHHCPTCSGLPYRPHPIVICGGGQQDGGDCPCIDTPIQITGLGASSSDVSKHKRE
ncbi:prominin-like protein isoform X1 [Drosophila montana]|uniref:prominin-like protein isoform X1 n=1 Tax=Drosophila montana TaxID=40370 RepID=UPI00313BF074